MKGWGPGRAEKARRIRSSICEGLEVGKTTQAFSLNNDLTLGWVPHDPKTLIWTIQVLLCFQ